jgi:acetoin utilization deacetylase AcuC-like enzyme
MLILTTPRFQEHVTPPGHPERPERAHTFDVVAGQWKDNGVRTAAPRAATDAELALIHDASYLDAIRQIAGRPAMLDADTFMSPESPEIARLAAGATIEAAMHAVDAREPAFALVRPPGHHAERDRAMGFCLFNNVAIAAAVLLARGLERIAIVDIDVHHGNGTQFSFYDDPRVLYLSTHQFPFYPGTGDADEIGTGDGHGFTVNVPMESGSGDADYQLVHREIVLPVLDQFRPQLTLVSAGYDAHERDPLASMRMTATGYAAIVRGLRDCAARHGALAFVTEGGYELPALAACLNASIAVLTETAGDGNGSSVGTEPLRGRQAVSRVRKSLAARWSL